MKKLLLVLTIALARQFAFAQIESHITWAYAAKKATGSQATVFLKANLDEGWHIYAVNAKESPLKTKINFTAPPLYKTVGGIIEPMPVSTYNAAAKMKLIYFENSILFQQKIALTGKKASVKGTVDYVVCNDIKCNPPATIGFTVPVAL